MKTLVVFCAFTEKYDIQGWGVHKKLIQRGGLPKKGELGQFTDLRGAWQENGNGGEVEGS